MAKKYRYYVVGGQYQSFCYGGTPTLLGAKRLASRNVEYWDNWQGWHVPAIFRAEDVRRADNYYGVTTVPVDGVNPVAVAHYNNGRVIWEEV